MNSKKFRSLLLASVAAGFMITSFADSAYASSSHRALTESALSSNLDKYSYAYATPGSFTTTARCSRKGCWTLENKSASITDPADSDSKITAKFKSIKLGTTDDKVIKEGLEASIRPYITYIVGKDPEAFNSALPSLTAWEKPRTRFDFDDKKHNPFSLLSVAIEDETYSLFKSDMAGDDVDTSTAFFYTFSVLAKDKLLASHVLKMINEEVSKATPKTKAKETPKKPGRSSLVARGTPKKTPSKETKSLSETPSGLLRSTQKQRIDRRISLVPIDEVVAPTEEIEKDPFVAAPTHVPTTPISTGGQDLLDLQFDNLLGDEDDLFDEEDATPKTVVHQNIETDLPAPNVTVTAPTLTVTTPEKEKEKAPKKKKGSKQPEPKGPTEEEIQESIATLIATTYPGLKGLLAEGNEDLSPIARELLQKEETRAKSQLKKFDAEIGYFYEQKAKLNSDDLSGFTSMLSAIAFDALVGEALDAFDGNAQLKRFTSSEGMVFVRDRSGMLLVSIDGKLYKSEDVYASIDEQRADIVAESKVNLKRAKKEFKDQYKNLIHAKSLVDSLDIASRRFARAAVREAEKESPHSSLEAILQAKLRAKVTA